MSVECQVHVKSQSELDIGGRETCIYFLLLKQNIDTIFFKIHLNIIKYRQSCYKIFNCKLF